MQQRVKPFPVVGFGNTRVQLNKQNQGEEEDHMTLTDFELFEHVTERLIEVWLIGQ